MINQKIPKTQTNDGRELRQEWARWWRAGLAMGTALVLVTVLTLSAWFFARSLALIFMGLVVAAALAPPVQYMQRWMPRPLAVVLAYLVLAVIGGGLAWLIVPSLLGEIGNLIERLPALLGEAETWLAERGLLPATIPLRETVLARLETIRSGEMISAGTALTGVYELIFAFVISIYWLLVLPRLRHFTLELVPSQRQEAADETIDALSIATGGYVRGVILQICIIAVIVYAGLAIIGVNYALVLALMAGLLEAIPTLGSWTSSALIMLFALSQSLTLGLLTLAFVVVVQFLEGMVLTPLIIGGQARIPALLVLAALIVGASSGGLVGALVAVPLVGALRVLVLRVALPGLRRL
jgi:predicted PurR-regulated permease PerM